MTGTHDRYTSGQGNRGRNGVPTTRRFYRLPLDLAERLASVSVARGVSENLLVVRAIDAYLDELPALPPAGNSAEMLEQATAALDGIHRRPD